mgnify:CR=1 FL=1
MGRTCGHCGVARPSLLLVELRTHTQIEPIPFLIYYPGIEPDAVQTYDEISCKEGGYGLMEKDEFMNLFMNIQ